VGKFTPLALLFLALPALGQEPARRSLWEPADTFDRARFWMVSGAGATLYAASFVGLYHAWYKEHELGPFRFFNDAGEWLDMDKAGHVITTYAEADVIFQLARWTGLNREQSLFAGVGAAMLLQTTIEVMDGFSTKWGFSWPDMAANALGAGVFAGQELLWREQRLRFKVSSTRPEYPDYPVYSLDGMAVSSPRRRAQELFGRSFAETVLKDYNGMTVWLSVNPSAFLTARRRPESRFPPWLNVAVGLGAMNMYGGYSNSWKDEAGHRFVLPESAYPRYRQFYLSLDVDLSRIPTRSRLLRGVFSALNWIKIPAPALEINTLGQTKGHWMLW
jgi:uncharacterized protein YfiM (DUF2279 family)